MTAEQCIGPSTGGDRLNVEAIAASLPDDCGELRQILQDPSVAGLDVRRRRASSEASRERRLHRRLAAAVVFGSGLAALASGLLLYGQGRDAAIESPETTTSTVSGLAQWADEQSGLVTVIQILALLAATVAGSVIAQRNPGEIWTRRRRNSEALRVGIVEKVLEFATMAPGGGPSGRLRQFLEFLRRYQLDLQIGFYADKGAKAIRSDTSAVWAIAGLGGIAAVAALIGTLGGENSAFPVAAAFLGIAVPIVLASVQSWRTTNRAKEKADSYRAALEGLEDLRLELGTIRAQADAGDAIAVAKFVNEIHAVMRAESGAFVGGGPVDAYGADDP